MPYTSAHRIKRPQCRTNCSVPELAVFRLYCCYYVMFLCGTMGSMTLLLLHLLLLFKRILIAITIPTCCGAFLLFCTSCLVCFDDVWFSLNNPSLSLRNYLGLLLLIYQLLKHLINLLEKKLIGNLQLIMIYVEGIHVSSYLTNCCLTVESNWFFLWSVCHILYLYSSYFKFIWTLHNVLLVFCQWGAAFCVKGGIEKERAAMQVLQIQCLHSCMLLNRHQDLILYFYLLSTWREENVNMTQNHL